MSDYRSCSICGMTVDVSKGHVTPDPDFTMAGRQPTDRARDAWAHTCVHHTDEQRKATGNGCPCCAIYQRDQWRACSEKLAYSYRENNIHGISNALAEFERLKGAK